MPTWYYLALMIPGILGFAMVLFTPMLLKVQEDRNPQKLKKRPGAQNNPELTH